MDNEYNVMIKNYEVELSDYGYPVLYIEFEGYPYAFFWILPIEGSIILKLMEVVDVTKLSGIKGKIVRAVSNGSTVNEIRHPIKDISLMR